jgi:hypothetical protein
MEPRQAAMQGISRLGQTRYEDAAMRDLSKAALNQLTK